MKLPSKLFTFALFVSFLVFSPLTASAFSIQPALQDISLDPGQEFQGKLSIVNDQRIPQNFHISIQKFIPQGDSGQQIFLEGDDRSGLPEWMRLERDILRLDPHARGVVKWTVNVPLNARPGGYYVAIFVAASTDGTEDGPVPLLARIGMLLFVRVNGNVSPNFTVKDFFSSEKSLRRLPVKLTAVISNHGNVHGLPDGKVEIRNLFGKIVKIIPLNLEKVRVLPDSEHRISIVWQDEVQGEGSGFFSEVIEEWRNFGFGPYTLTATVYGQSPEELRVRVERVFIWPSHLLLTAFLGFIMILASFYGYGRLVLKRAISH